MKNWIYISLLFLAACGGKTQPTAEETKKETTSNEVTLTPEQVKNVDLETEVPSVRSGSNYLSVRGEITAPPQNKISITSPLGGYVKQIKLQIGDKVKKGEVLVVMEDMQFIQLQQEYLGGKTTLNQLKAEYERQDALSKTQAASTKQAEQAYAAYENQKIAVKANAEKLNLLGINPETLQADELSSKVVLRSPIDGFVTAVNTNIGKYVSGTETLIELIDPTDIHLSLQIFEKDLASIQIGQHVIAYTNTNPDKKYKAEVVLIGKTVLPDKSVEVHCHFEQFPPELIPGLYMNAEIETQSLQKSTVPTNAVLQENDADYVFVDKGQGTFHLMPVNVNWTENDSSGISQLDGSRITQKVVVKNAYTVYMQLRNEKD